MATRKRVSKQDWLEKGLEVLEREGVAGVKVLRMARELGINKSGFYWHFRDRADLLRQMLAHWAHEYTEVLSENVEVRQAEPAQRLRLITETIIQHDLARYDLAIRAWAHHDPETARVLKRVMDARLAFVTQAFAELGFEGDELEMRARLFVAYHSWEVTTFPKVPKKRLRALIDRRLKLLLSPEVD